MMKFAADGRAMVELAPSQIEDCWRTIADLARENSALRDALGELHRECIAAAVRAGTTWPLSGPAAALDAKCRAALGEANDG